jgi:hypothetical protein
MGMELVSGVVGLIKGGTLIWKDGDNSSSGLRLMLTPFLDEAK